VFLVEREMCSRKSGPLKFQEVRALVQNTYGVVVARFVWRKMTGVRDYRMLLSRPLHINNLSLMGETFYSFVVVRYLYRVGDSLVIRE